MMDDPIKKYPKRSNSCYSGILIHIVIHLSVITYTSVFGVKPFQTHKTEQSPKTLHLNFLIVLPRNPNLSMTHILIPNTGGARFASIHFFNYLNCLRTFPKRVSDNQISTNYGAEDTHDQVGFQTEFIIRFKD